MGIEEIVNTEPTKPTPKHKTIEIISFGRSLIKLIITLMYNIFHMNVKKFFVKQNIFFGLILIAVFFIGFAATYFTLKLTNFSFGTRATPTPVPSAQPAQVNFAPPPEIKSVKGVYNTVFLGYGGTGHDGALLTDSIIVVHVDTNKKTAALISIPRDLWVNGGHKINAEGSINGFQNEGGAIKNITGLPIDYFVAVDFGGFTKLIDNLGGITANNPKTLDDPYYPILGLENEICGKTPDEINALKAKYSGYQLEIQFICRYEHLHYDVGNVNLDGTNALKFVRSRHGDSDFGRSARQFAVLRGVLTKLISLHAFDKTSDTVNSLLKIVRTNLNITGIQSLFDAVGPVTNYKITEIHLTTDNMLNEGTASDGQYILYPKAGMLDFSQIKSFIAGQI